MIVGIMGESGAGKTTSARTLDPKTTMYVDCDKKGLSWRGWKTQYSVENKNYMSIDTPQNVLKVLKKVDKEPEYAHINTIIVDTLNGIMVADEMRRSKEKGYDKWMDLASCIYDIVDYGLTVRDNLNVVFICHTQTEHTEDGYINTRIKTSGKKLDKIVLESKFNIVLLAKCVDGEYLFETQANFSTAKSPMGMFAKKEIPNDLSAVLKAVNEY